MCTYTTCPWVCTSLADYCRSKAFIVTWCDSSQDSPECVLCDAAIPAVRFLYLLTASWLEYYDAASTARQRCCNVTQILL